MYQYLLYYNILDKKRHILPHFLVVFHIFFAIFYFKRIFLSLRFSHNLFYGFSDFFWSFDPIYMKFSGMTQNIYGYNLNLKLVYIFCIRGVLGLQSWFIFSKIFRFFENWPRVKFSRYQLVWGSNCSPMCVESSLKKSEWLNKNSRRNH